MIEVCPEYYKDFKCISSACRHSCCIGWEIDIDPDSAERFKVVEGKLGDKLRRCISEGTQPHFILAENERCPFLNGENLCEIILELGEDAICQICTDHPRFRTYLSERTEIGLGLCCEEAARLIIGRQETFSLVEEGTGEYSLDEDYLLDLRDEIFEIMNERDKPFCGRMERVLSLCETDSVSEDIKSWAEFFMQLERLDEGWTDTLSRIVACDIGLEKLNAYMESHSLEFGNLFNYFIYRHFFSALDDGDIASKAAFAVLSCRMIAAACIVSEYKDEFASICECARMYSSEIEYSDENLELIFDELS